VEDSVILPDVHIGTNCIIKRAVIDRGCIVPDNTVIGENIAEDRRRFRVTRDGVTLVTPEMLGQELHRVL